MGADMNQTATSMKILAGTALAVAITAGSAGGCMARRGNSAAQKPTPAPAVSSREVAKFKDPAAVAELKDRATNLILKLTSDPNPLIRANAIEALADSPARLEPEAVKALIDPNAGVRSTAAMMIGRLQLSSQVASVTPLLKDPSSFVRASAIYALARCGQNVDQSPLAELLLGDPSPRIRSHAAFLIGELGETSAAAMLREAAKSRMNKASPSEVRLMQLQIAEALVKLGDDSQMETIRAALYPSRPEDLEAAALAVQIIGQVKDRGAIDHLIYLTAYRDNKGGQMPAEVRLGAASSLARMGLDQGAFIADEYAGSPNPVLRAQAAFVYGQVGRSENLPKLERMMGDAEGQARVSAAAGVLKAGSILAQQTESR